MRGLHAFLTDSKEHTSNRRPPSVKEVWKAGDLSRKLEMNQAIAVRASWQVFQRLDEA
jgi:hypothetical protein